MNNIPFAYPISYNQQQIPTFTQHSSCPYVFIMPPYYNFPHSQPQTFQFYPNNSTISPFKTQILDFQQKQKNQKDSRIKEDIDYSPRFRRDKRKHRIQRLRDDKGRYYGVRQVPIKDKYQQNPKRNVITNVGNQLLSYISNIQKSSDLIKKVDSSLTQKQIQSFYSFMQNLRKRTDYYLNIRKMKQLWFPSHLSPQQVKQKNLSLLRRISYYYLNNMMPLFIMNSGKIKRSTKIFHIKAIRLLLQELSHRKQI